MAWTLIEGDCIEEMRAMEPDSVDAVVTDAPYGLEFMGKEWDRFGAKDIGWIGYGDHMKDGSFGPWGRKTRPMMPNYYGRRNEKCLSCDKWRVSSNPCTCQAPEWGSQQRQGAPPTMLAFQEWSCEWAIEAWRVLKPGGHLLCFGGTRTSHRLVCAIEDAGFEIRDSVCWLHGQGFPKSHDVAKGIDKAAGAEREVIGEGKAGAGFHYGDPGEGGFGRTVGKDGSSEASTEWDVTAPATPEAERWQGWGTALKPSFEPIVLARKPLAGTVVENVLEFGTGAINVDATRIEADYENEPGRGPGWLGSGRQERPDGDWQGPSEKRAGSTVADRVSDLGRWPANVVLDEEAAEALDEQTGNLPGGTPRRAEHGKTGTGVTFVLGGEHAGFGDQGGPASRFYYVAKATRSEREAGLRDFAEETVQKTTGRGVSNCLGSCPEHGAGLPSGSNMYACGCEKAYEGKGELHSYRNPHPTVKPIALMRWLVKLVTPPGGTILDCFVGSGTTGIAAGLEGFDFIGIEREANYCDIARARLTFWAEHGEAAMETVRREERSERKADEIRQAGQLTLAF